MTTSPSSAAPFAAPREPGRLVTVAVLLVASMTIMANATIAPSLPGLRAHFADQPGIDTLAGLILTLPSASVILTAGLFGWLADRVNRLVLLGFAMGIYALGGATGLLADTLDQLLVGRAALGLGVAGTMTLAMAFAADIWHGPARARYMGLQGAAMSGGGIVVMVLGGLLASFHWRGAFAVYLLALPIVVLAIAVLRPYARTSGPAHGHKVEPGEVVDGPFPWGAFAFTGGLAFLFMTTFYVMPTRMPFRLGEVGVTSSATVGLIMACMMTTALPGALGYGRLRRVFSPMALFALSFLGLGLGLVIVSQAQTLPVAVLGTVVAGLGLGPAMPNYSTYFMNRVPAAKRGRAAGLLTTSFYAGQFASPLVSAPLVSVFGLAQSFLVMGAVLLLTAAVLGMNMLRLAGRGGMARA